MKRELMSGLSALAAVLAGVAGTDVCRAAGPCMGSEPAAIGDFAKWKISEPYRIVGEELVYEARECRAHDTPTYAIRPEPGWAYQFTAVQHVRGVTNEVQVLLDWSDERGRPLGRTIGVVVAANRAAGKGWSTYSAISKLMPTNAVTLKAGLYIKNGACGRYRVKDCRLVKLPEAPLQCLVTSRYRDEAVDGAVRFLAPTAINELRHPLDRVKAELAFAGLNGSETRPMALTSEAAELTLQAKDLAFGRHPVVCRLSDRTADGWKPFAEVTNLFTRLERPVPRRVTLDETRRFRVDGKPFFPIAITVSKGADLSEVARLLKGSAINTVFSYDKSVTPKDLDLLWENGLMFQYNLKDVYTDFPHVNPPKGVVTAADEERFVREKVALLKDHPALLCWYITDEFPVEMRDRVKARTELLHELDGDHPTNICLNRPHCFRAFLGAGDVYGSDPYPIGKVATAAEAGAFAREWARTTYEQLFGLRAMKQTVQAYARGWFRPGARARFPTREEMSLMAHAQIDEGATGIGFYSLSCMMKRLQGEAFTNALNDVKAVASEIAQREGGWILIQYGHAFTR